MPSSAAIAPTPTGTAFCIASPRVRHNRAASEIDKPPAAASAEYSPSECPATKAASRATEKPASLSSTRKVAIETAISAGCAFSVSCSFSAGPSQIVAVSFSPSAASPSSNTARAAGKASAKALPMPTACDPWPGKVNAAVIGDPLSLNLLEDGGVSHRPRRPCQAAGRPRRRLGLETAGPLVAADGLAGPGPAQTVDELARAIVAIWLCG